jgi:hypothetical protein
MQVAQGDSLLWQFFLKTLGDKSVVISRQSYTIRLAVNCWAF